jgi:carbon storage regulator
MLVIRRHAGESIWIGEEVEIEVMECGSNRVKLGIRAPKNVAVVRNEARETREQNMAASRAMETGRLGAFVEQMRARPRTSIEVLRRLSDKEQ